MQAPWQADPIVSDDAPWERDPVSNQDSGGFSLPQPIKKGIGAMESVGQGLSLGFADEIRSGVASGAVGAGRMLRGKAPDFGKTFVDAQKAQKDFLEPIRDDQPLTNIAGNVIGGVATGALTGGQAIAAAPSALGQAARGAGVGAATGGAFGFGAAEGGIAPRAADAARGAAVGAAMGAAAPVIFGAVQAGVRKATGGLARDQRVAINELRKAMTRDHGAQKANSLLGYWQRNGSDPEALIKMQGENGQKLIQAVGQIERGQATQAFSALKASTRSKVTNAVTNSLSGGQKVSVPDAKRLINATMRSKAEPLYEAAFDRGISRDVYRGYVQELVADNKQAIRSAISIATQRKDRAAAQMLRNALNGKEEMLNLKAFQYFKEGLDDQINRIGSREGGNNLAGAMRSRLNETLEQIDAFNPEYSQARKVWRSGKLVDDAFQAGEEIMRPESVAKFGERLRGMSQAELQAARVGAAEKLETLIRSRPDAASSTSRLMNDVTKDKLRALFADDPSEAEAFIKIVSGVDDDWRMFNSIDPSANSRTASNQQALREFDEGLRTPGLRDVSGEATMLGTARKTLRNVGDKGFEARKERVAQELADIIFGGQMPQPASASNRLRYDPAPVGAQLVTGEETVNNGIEIPR